MAVVAHSIAYFQDPARFRHQETGNSRIGFGYRKVQAKPAIKISYSQPAVQDVSRFLLDLGV